MSKRKSQKNNSQPSAQTVPPQKPAILRIVKQNTTDTSTNSPASSELSTAVAKENNPVASELPVDNNQNKSIEISSQHNTSALNCDAVPQIIMSENEQSDLPLKIETVSANVEELTTNKQITTDALAETDPNKELTQSGKHKSYKPLETATNSQGQSFSGGEKIEVLTCNFGTQQAVLEFLYSTPDGSIWASYSPLNKEQKQQWRRGCCRIEYLTKVFTNQSDI
ncbi:hypothetical protein NIES2111_65970 (plasmid) [Nostoc sp. NIES-2111]|nr:hypothetical protein NIES2111_65970 [Nostoc sp. NIES-2111]